MKPIARADWPEWLQRLRHPWRFVGGRIEDVSSFTAIYGVTRNLVFHYTSSQHVEGVKTIWPMLTIEDAQADDIVRFLRGHLLDAVARSGNKIITIPQCVIRNRAEFPAEVSMVASTLFEMARKKEREERKAKKRTTTFA